MTLEEAFPDRLVLEPLSPAVCDGKQKYFVREPFTYRSAAFGCIIVPSALITDFASVPRLVWSYLSPEDPCILFASVVHDYIYTVRGEVPGRTLTRADADAVLREAMLVCGARSTQAAVVHRMVRMFGGSHWK